MVAMLVVGSVANLLPKPVAGRHHKPERAEEVESSAAADIFAG